MDNIIKPNDSFDFTKLSLTQPSGIQGGAYFTKLEYNSKPLYIQTTKSFTKQGLVKSGKKYHLDIMFDNNSETIIHWFENVEEKCKKLICERKDTWFQNSLEESDIENAFNSIIRVYKSGKYYLVRTNIKNSQTGDPSVKIYNEYEVAMNPEDLHNDSEIISILEIQGIKFTSRNFQIEIELKQIMILDNEPIFNNCLIKSEKSLHKSNLDNVGNIGNISNIENLDKISTLQKDMNVQTKSEITEHLDNNENLDNDKQLIDIKDLNVNNTLPNDNATDTKNLIIVSDNNTTNTNTNSNNNYNDKITDNESFINIEMEELTDDINDKKESKELEELEMNNIDLENLEKFTLKKPNKVYFDLYKEARKKAKLAKKNAILAFLEAKNIKKTYMLENLNDSDSDFDEEFDEEIEEVSESELDGL